MDPRRFDEVARRLAQTLSRRSVVGGSLWAALLAALPPGATVLGKNRHQLTQRRQNEREREQRQREHDRNRRDNDNDRNQRNKNDGGKNDGGKNNGGGNGKGSGKDKRDDGKNRDRNRNRDSKDNDNRGSNQNVQGEGCLRNGKRCGQGKKLRPCSRCCSVFNITTRSKKKKCACRPDGRRCQDNSQCCARVCFEGVCGALS